MKLTKSQTRTIIEARGIKHTDECRAHNPKGAKRHHDGCPEGLFPERLSIFGGYHCICDFTARVHANIDALGIVEAIGLLDGEKK